jgi:hypothetical protein
MTLMRGISVDKTGHIVKILAIIIIMSEFFKCFSAIGMKPA